MRTFLFISCQNYISDRLNVEHQLPLVWSTIMPIIKHRQGNLDGLLLDWQLQREEEAGDYSSASLAQHLRVLATEGSLTDLPIVLCSAQDDFARKYKQDLTTHDLFDMVYSKTDLSEDHTQAEFIALANGYRLLNASNKTPHGILGITQNEYENLDIRFQAEFKRLFDVGSPAHQIAQFLLREVLEHQGILIDEDVLAARLGVDKSSPAWESLKEKLKTTRYKGVFGEAWVRWWWFGVENWWREIAPNTRLQMMSAEARIQSMASLGLELRPATKTTHATSDEFWAVCDVSKKPIDIMDGFILNKQNNHTWQEREYVSNETALSLTDLSVVDVLEQKRLQDFRRSLQSNS